MDLPRFNPEGQGAQGTGNIPPEAFRQGLSPADLDLLGATTRPEDNPAVQSTMNQQVDAMLAETGLATPSEGPGTAAVEAESPTTPTPQGQAPEDSRDEKLERLRGKYGDNYDELAKAYLNINRTSLQTNQENADLRRELSEIKSMLGERQYSPEQARLPQAEAPLTPDDFYRDPIATTSKIISEQLVGFAQALESQRVNEQRENQFRQTVEKRQTEIERLSPIMEDIAGRRPELYRALPRETALDLLLEQARDREAATRGVALQSELYQTMGWHPATPTNTAPPVGAGGFPVGGVASTRAVAPPQGSGPTPGQGWANTGAMQRLMRSTPDTSSEDRALNEVLKERQFGEHIPIY
jgi:hypothetical protein